MESDKTEESIFIKEVFAKKFYLKTLKGFNESKLDIFINTAINNKKSTMKNQKLVDFSVEHGIDLKKKLIDLLANNFNYNLYNE